MNDIIRFVAMEKVLGKERFAQMMVTMINYRADPECWDALINVMDRDKIISIQAHADQAIAEFKDAGS